MLPLPEKHKTPDGYKLGAWVGKQRTTKDTLPEDRRKRLDELGFEDLDAFK
ncbi:MAG: hypothetical protein CMQ40_04205 [Gammaproteobacteria bacterium]|nr:hypothetical protein [Gammaproteobacteria bacterium]